MTLKVLIISSDQNRVSQWQQDIQAEMKNVDIRSDTSLLGFSRQVPDLCFVDVASIAELNKDDLKSVIQQFSETRFVVLVAVPEAGDGIGWIQAGAKAYINRLISSEVLHAALNTIESGEIWAGKHVVQALLSQLQQNSAIQGSEERKMGLLTERERELAGFISDGLSNKQIAEKSGITERTVKAHLNNIFKKVDVSSRVQLALLIEKEKNEQSSKINAV